MKIEFGSSKLQKLCSSEKAMRKEWGAEMAKRLMQRLADLEAIASLDEARNLPGRCHELTGDRAGQLAMDLVHPQRLVFKSGTEPKPTNKSGGLDWKQVTAIRILEIVNYHE